MGGKAFSGIGQSVERMDRETYINVRDEILNILDHYAQFRFKHVQELPDKQSFGDIDFLIESQKEDILPKLEALFKPFDSVLKRNGDVISVFYKGKYQIDFIVIDFKYFDSASLFYNYNDVGNLIGRLFRRYGYKLTPKGLFYPIVHNHHGVIGEVFISSVPSFILDILGLSIVDYRTIYSREKLFEWLASSKYFVKDIYSLENLTNANRRRDKKRPTYTAFVEWLKDRDYPDKNQIISLSDLDSSYIMKAAEIITTYNQNLEITTKFNGRKFLDRGVDPKRIGEFKKFINWAYNREFLLFIEDEVADIIINDLIAYDAKYSLEIMYKSN